MNQQSLDLLDKANSILDGMARDEVREWKDLKCTQVAILVIQSNIESLKETWESSSETVFDNAVQNAKARGKATAFREALSIMDDVMRHLEPEEEDNEDVKTIRPQSSIKAV